MKLEQKVTNSYFLTVVLSIVVILLLSNIVSDIIFPFSHHSVEVHQEHPENHKVNENGGRCQVCSRWEAAEASPCLWYWCSGYVHLPSMLRFDSVFIFLVSELRSHCFLSALQPCMRRPISKHRRTRLPSIWLLVWPLTVDSVVPSTPVWPRPLRARSPTWPVLGRRWWWSMWETSWEDCCTGTNPPLHNNEWHESGPVLA